MKPFIKLDVRKCHKVANVRACRYSTIPLSSSISPNVATKAKENILSLSKEQFKQDLLNLGVKPIHIPSVWTRIYRGATSFSDIKDLGKYEMEKLDERYIIDYGNVQEHHVSDDGTQKWLISYGSNQNIETVFIPGERSSTVCLSSQVACSLSCKFCFTGAMDKKNMRNLKSEEIIGQFMIAKRALGDFHKGGPVIPIIHNIVFMGMGEPLYNYRNLKKAIDILTDQDGLALSRKKITVSTSGVVPLIERLGDELGTILAVSLHAVRDELRDELVPLNKTYNIKQILDACKRYSAADWNRKINFEYVMLKNVNDSLEEAKELSELVKGLPAFVNLIPFNPWPGSNFQCSSRERIVEFSQVLWANNIKTTIRWPKGRDIFAACGQLNSSHQTHAELKPIL